MQREQSARAADGGGARGTSSNASVPDGIDPRHWNKANGMGVVLREQAAAGEPAWAYDLAPCAVAGSCAARLELLAVAEALRRELQAAGERQSRAAP